MPIQPKSIVLLILLASIFVASSAAAAEKNQAVQWFRDVDMAWKHSQKSGRPLLLLFTTENCSFCNRMKKQTLRDVAVNTTIGQSYVAVILREADHPNLVTKLNVQSYPTTVIISPNAKVLRSIVGYVEPNRYRQLLRLAATTRVSQN